MLARARTDTALDYIGNTVIQRLFERCSEMTKSMMLEKVAPYLGSIGVHKNGTWAAQKIIDTAKLPAQVTTGGNDGGNTNFFFE